LEIADVLVVNKADREGADRAVRDLVAMLELRGPGKEPVEIIRTVATTAKGIDELAHAVERHRERHRRAEGPGGSDLPARLRRRAAAALGELVVARLRRAVDEVLASRAALVDELAARTPNGIDPYTAADELAAELMTRVTSGT